MQGPTLSDEQQCQLLQPSTILEIKNMFSINFNKSPDPDSRVFFRDAWGIIGDDICMAVQDFSIRGNY